MFAVEPEDVEDIAADGVARVELPVDLHPRLGDRFGAAIVVLSLLVCVPAISFAQASPFMTGATALQTNILNELYLSTVYRPTAGVAASVASKLLRRTHSSGMSLELADALDACVKLRETLRASLARYEPEILSLYARGGRTCSAPLRLFATLINGEVRDVPLPRAPLTFWVFNAALSRCLRGMFSAFVMA